MRKVLIVGKNSYVGNSFKHWAEMNYSDFLTISTVSSRNEEWKNENFRDYDTILHVAGIAHQNEKKITSDEYNKINCELAYDVAKEAKKRGVKQFIFLSTMSVYGINEGIINHSTPMNPKSKYGKSKYKAEKKLITLEDEDFLITIVRPPMIYGPNSPGNYQLLSCLSKIIPLLPVIRNERSMIFVDNLSEFLSSIILNNSYGEFCPQNNEYTCTSTMMHQIRMVNQKNTIKVYIPNFFVKVLKKRISIFNKMYGNLVYEKAINGFMANEQQINFEESIKISEKRRNT